MRQASEFESRPTDYSLVVPDGWFQLALAPDVRDSGIVALADQQFRGVDNAPHIKKQLMRDLQKKTKEAYKAGGVELYLSTLTIGSLPLASSLLVSIPSPEEFPRCSDPHELAEHLDHDVGDVRVVELAVAGWAVRQRLREAPDPAAQMGNSLPTTTLTYYCPIPASTYWLMLNFSTPLEPLADRMVELFDVVAGTLHWS
ncbi:hypothetical protein [Streptomyces sp. H27-C3]|uniref:hypothetical protein n=1 Tax=Streptomyces sp. H27-C3 TaxID=3046305 RepID=UPI0024B91DD4|nr:hypothetical protein [Streptomyces sp. H27-C3]MDJ0464423.1 hypothetical protein [Streptomyces sp. H27-C3]